MEIKELLGWETLRRIEIVAKEKNTTPGALIKEWVDFKLKVEEDIIETVKFANELFSKD